MTKMTLRILVSLIAVSSAWPYTFLDPPRRVFVPPVEITVDERGLATAFDFDHGVTAAIEAAGEWNTKDRVLVRAQAGPVPQNLRTGDGVSTVRFDDPQKTCTQRLRCLAASFVTYKTRESGTCGGLDLVGISETDVVFNPEIPVWNTRYTEGPCIPPTEHHSNQFFGFPLETVVTHEVGHALGLGHSDDLEAVMGPANVDWCVGLTTGEDDWAGIDALYGCDLVIGR